ncbi:MAG: gliding motility-associated C-terminal domain-containing protein [Flavobacteriales bacterium]|jgi:gliding motility-associated-like protein|nr:gliding motility-associated C-terminal domain-containing protein [Flavobacteriales bacterium]
MIRLIVVFLFLTFWGFSQEHKGGYTFIENKNQWHQNVQYKADVQSGFFYLENDGFLFNLMDVKKANAYIKSHYDKTINRDFKTLDWHAYKVQFKNSSPNVELEGSDQTPEYYNFFVGDDASKWAGNVKAYHTINYKGIYEGIDARVYTKLFDLKYDLIVRKGANPNAIAIAYQGADKVEIRNERLHIFTTVNHIVEDKPFAYQIIEGKVVEVPCAYRLDGNVLTFDLPEGYHPSYDLVIDPTLKFSTYSGSFSNNFGYTATFDSKGFLYSGSSAFGNQYPTTLGAYNTSFSGGIVDIAISKFDTTGTFLLYSTYLGGSSDELPHSLIVNSLDELFVLGTTSSNNFPTTVGCYDATFNGGTPNNLQNGLGVNYVNGSDLIVSHLSANGANLLGSTYLGGSQNDGLNSTSTNANLNILRYNYADEVRGELDIDQNNNIYIISCTRSSDYPVTANAFQTTYGGGSLDACVTKMDNALQNVIWSSFLGGENHDAGYSLALDSQDDLYVTGGTASVSFPTTTGAYQTTLQGGRSDGFITKISQDGQSIVNSSYYGSSTYDQSYFVELDNDNAVYLFGQTEHSGTDFIQNATWNVPGSGQFISKLSPQLNTRIYSTVFGAGNGINISPTAFLVDVCDKIYLSGWGGSVNSLGSLANNAGTTNNMPITFDAFQSTTDGSDFYVMVMQDDATSLVYGSYFGSASATEHVDGGTSRFDRKGKIYQAMCAGCGGDSNMPILPANAVSSTNNNSCNLGVFKMDFEIPSIIADFVAPPLGCAPYTYTFENTSLVQPNTTYSWDFGDGNTSSVANPTNSYTQPGTYTIQLIVSDAASCNLADTIEQEIIVLGNTSSSLQTVNICPSETAQIGLLPNPDPSITYQWSPATGLSSTTVSNPFANPTITTNYILLVSNGTCTDTVRQTVQVNTPLLSVSDDTTLCFVAGNVNLVANSSGTSDAFVWSSSNLFQDTLNGNINDSVLSLMPANTAQFYIKANNNGCEIIDSVAVTTIYGDVTVSGSNAICAGDALSISASTTFSGGVNLTYDWSPDASINSGDGSPTIQVSPLVTTTYALAINADGCLDTLEHLVHVTAVDVFIPNDTIVCNANLGVNFNATSSLGNTSFVWSTNAQITDTINGNASNGSLAVLPQNDTTLYILAESNGCSVVDSVSVDVVFGQTGIIGPVAGCQGDLITLQATNTASTNNVNYDWEPDGTIISGDGTASVVVSPQANTVYRLYAENGGCFDTLQHVLTITPIELVVTEDTVLCFDTLTVDLVANANGTSSEYIWSSTASFADTLNAPIVNNQITVQGSGFDVYYVKVENNGCILIDSVMISSVFGNHHVVAPPSMCKGDTVSVMVHNDYLFNTMVHDWEPDSVIVSGDFFTPILTNPTQTTHYTVTSSFGQCSDVISFTINVVDLTLSTSNDTVLCTDTSIIDLWANTGGTSSNFVWSQDPNFSDTINQPLSDSTITISPVEPTMYYVQVSEDGCVLTDSVSVVVTSGQISLSVPGEICRGDQTTITVTNLAPNYPLTYDWSPDNQIIAGDGTTTITVQPDTTTVYTVQGTNTFGCEVEDEVTVTVNQLGFINVQATASNDTIVEGGSTTLYASPNGGNYTYTWIEGVSSPNSAVTQVNPTITTTYYLTVEENGCTKSDSITIYVKELLCGEEDVYVPNAFTPNSDHANDNLYVRGNNIEKLLFRVYDRWGELVFETTQQGKGWDGKYKGKDCDPAVFVYYLEVTCGEGETYFEKGNITLIR